MRVTVKQAYEDYLLYIENRQKKQSKKTLRERFNNIILPFFKDYDIKDIKKVDYIKFQNELLSKNYSYNYIRNIHFYIEGFLNYCINIELINYNVAKTIGMVKMNKPEKKDNFYTLEEFNKFIKNVDNKVYNYFFRFMFLTGCRPGETMALRFSDLNNNVISINKTIDEHGSREIGTPKTKNSIRNIEIPLILKIKLTKLKKYYIKKYNTNEDFYIFGGRKPLSPTTINRYKKKASTKANIKNITIHGFRHSHATLLMDKEISIKAISERLGHSNTSITLNTYIHSTSKQEKRVIRTLNFLRLPF